MGKIKDMFRKLYSFEWGFFKIRWKKDIIKILDKLERIINAYFLFCIITNVCLLVTWAVMADGYIHRIISVSSIILWVASFVHLLSTDLNENENFIDINNIASVPFAISYFFFIVIFFSVISIIFYFRGLKHTEPNLKTFIENENIKEQYDFESITLSDYINE